MRTLYLECIMGIKSDMMLGALLELQPNKHTFLKKISSIGLPGVDVKWRSVQKCGVWGTQVVVLVNGEKETPPKVSSNVYNSNPYLDYTEVVSLITKLDLPRNIQEDAIDVYTIMASAIAKTENLSLRAVGLKEAASLTSLTHIIGCCMLMSELKVSKIASSPIHIGQGKVVKPTGIHNVPSPAVKEILKDAPTFFGEIDGELCDLTGAALIKHFIQDFSEIPIMQVEKIGYGMGEETLPIANCLRVFLGNLAYRPQAGGFAGLYYAPEEAHPEYLDYIMKKLEPKF